MNSAKDNKYEVTFGVCVYENSRTLRRCLDSIIHQETDNWKIQILVSESEDDSKRIAEEYKSEKIIVTSKSVKQSWAESSLELLNKCDTKYFMWLDADDFVSKNWVMKILEQIPDSKYGGSAGIIKLSNDGGSTFISNVSDGRSHSFAQSINSNYRLFRYVFTPESFGAVNLLYSVWDVTFLRENITWRSSESSVDFDTEFLLQALSKKPILISNEAILIRENSGYGSEVSFGSRKTLITPWKNFSRFAWQILITRPRSKRYFHWARKQSFDVFLIVVGTLVIRTIFSSFAPTLIVAHLRFKSLKDKWLTN
jgi:glycosyltransferase involved in cell wall biosynthesis